MIIAQEERSSRGPLFAFIDLLFLLVAFFTLLVFFIQQRSELSAAQMETVQQHLSRITGEEVELPQALETLESMVDRFVEAREAERERERQAAERSDRRAQRSAVRVEYTIEPDGRIRYEGRSYEIRDFVGTLVTPLRREHWLAFRAYAAPQTPFGTVVAHRRAILQGRTEFDTYWDNLAPSQAGDAPSQTPTQIPSPASGSGDASSAR